MLLRSSQQLFHKGIVAFSHVFHIFFTKNGRVFPSYLSPTQRNNPGFHLGLRQTALHFAAREGRDAAVRELIRRHADVARRTAHGILPLELAQPNCQTLIREEASRRIKAGMVDS